MRFCVQLLLKRETTTHSSLTRVKTSKKTRSHEVGHLHSDGSGRRRCIPSIAELRKRGRIFQLRVRYDGCGRVLSQKSEHASERGLNRGGDGGPTRKRDQVPRCEAGQDGEERVVSRSSG